MKQQEELLNTTDNKQSKFEPIEGTPFTIVTDEDKHFGIMGNHRLTEGYENIEECKKELLEINWNRLIQVMCVLISEDEKIKELKNS